MRFIFMFVTAVCVLFHSKQRMAVRDLSLHQGSTESPKTLAQKIYLSNRHS